MGIKFISRRFKSKSVIKCEEFYNIPFPYFMELEIAVSNIICFLGPSERLSDVEAIGLWRQACTHRCPLTELTLIHGQHCPLI